jgi:hypothetical protein
VDPRAGLDDMEKRKLLSLPGLELRPLGHPDRNQSLYRLSYPGFSHLTSVLPLNLNLYFDISFATVLREPALYRLHTFHVPNLMFISLA